MVDVVVVFAGPGKEQTRRFGTFRARGKARDGNTAFARTRNDEASVEFRKLVQVVDRILEFGEPHGVHGFIDFRRHGRRVGEAVRNRHRVGGDEEKAERSDEAPELAGGRIDPGTPVKEQEDGEFSRRALGTVRVAGGPDFRKIVFVVSGVRARDAAGVLRHDVSLWETGETHRVSPERDGYQKSVATVVSITT